MSDVSNISFLYLLYLLNTIISTNCRKYLFDQSSISRRLKMKPLTSCFTDSISVVDNWSKRTNLFIA